MQKIFSESSALSRQFLFGDENIMYIVSQSFWCWQSSDNFGYGKIHYQKFKRGWRKTRQKGWVSSHFTPVCRKVCHLIVWSPVVTAMHSQVLFWFCFSCILLHCNVLNRILPLQEWPSSHQSPCFLWIFRRGASAAWAPGWNREPQSCAAIGWFAIATIYASPCSKIKG